MSIEQGIYDTDVRCQIKSKLFHIKFLRSVFDIPLKHISQSSARKSYPET